MFVVFGAFSSSNPLQISQAQAAQVVDVPFYSQFKDISIPEWQKVGCGITSLAMILDYYKPAVAVNTLLKQGIDSGAYINGVGWSYRGLISVGKKYGLEGKSYDLAKSDTQTSFTELQRHLKDGPIMVSIHYKFDSTSTIPHLVVLNKMIGNTIYYNDPAAQSGNRKISSDVFLKAWKKRFIVIRPAQA